MQIDTRKLKKLIIKAVPYVAFSYVGNLIGFAYRTAEGNGFQEKILPFMSNLGVAFARIFPSLHPFDLLFGLVLAGVMRLVLYVKSKNKKKFRQGEEYGSAVWGGEKDIEPYMDLSCPENNVILTKTESLTMGKPSAPKFARNKNILVIGGSGSGKTRFFVKPNLMQMHSSYSFSASLIAVICINSFAQYYFGIVNSLLLNASQKGYIQYTIQIIALVLNTIVCAFLIKTGYSIQIVKLTTSFIFLLKPLLLIWYVKKHYNIDTKITYNEEPIKQKWNGMAQHFASYVLSGTDNIVLTLFSTLANVSIYSVYNIVIIGVKNALLSITNGFQSLMGEMLAKKEIEKLNSFFGYVEWVLHTATTLIFGCTGVLIVSFVRVYTFGIEDADYIQPLFAVLITIANASHCLRLPYNILILAAGHYKQTQSNYIIAMILNIVISISTVKIFGLIGVAIGTLVAMIYQTVWMAWYDSKHIINWPIKNFLKQIIVDAAVVIIASAITFKIPLLSVTYRAWFIRAIIVFACWTIISILINYLFYKDKVISVLSKMKKKIAR